MTQSAVAEQPIVLAPEQAADGACVDRLIDGAFGPGRLAKTAERLREGNAPRLDLSVCARAGGALVGAVRMWPIRIGEAEAIFLGPIAVDAAWRKHGVGGRMVEEACRRAEEAGLGVVLLVGDLPFFGPLGFVQAPRSVRLPGPVDPARVLWRALTAGALEGVEGEVWVPSRGFRSARRRPNLWRMIHAQTPGPSTPPGPGLAGVVAEASKPGRGIPPVHLWNPAHCGEIDIVINRNGQWLHDGSPIGREALVRLFSTVLRLDPDGFHLVTPVEKLKIAVEDAPFQAVRVDRVGDALRFQTNVGDETIAGADNPLRVVTHPVTGEPAPYVHVRRGLEARLSRPVFYELVEMAEQRETPDGPQLGLESQGVWFPLGSPETLGG